MKNQVLLLAVLLFGVASAQIIDFIVPEETVIAVPRFPREWDVTKRERIWLNQLTNFSREYEEATMLPECTNSMKPNCSVAANFWDKDAVIAVDGLSSGHGREGVRRILEEGRGHGPDTYFSIHWYYCKGSRKGVAGYGVGTVYSNDEREILEERRVLTFFRRYNGGGWKIQYSFELKGGDPHAANM
ncbi:unnamed protein product [Owenia fusiformis]|uniref:Uncharacterized protein n=1 Tax=Owenia fusiformis TaxID=6347 RepID=A0A8J1TMH5_OWEFU|nr:unnamed protein product [Owenia fusiformis]